MITFFVDLYNHKIKMTKCHTLVKVFKPSYKLRKGFLSGYEELSC